MVIRHFGQGIFLLSSAFGVAVAETWRTHTIMVLRSLTYFQTKRFAFSFPHLFIPYEYFFIFLYE